MIIEDDGPDSRDARVEAGTETTAGADIGSGPAERDASPQRTGSTQDPASELSEPVDLSGPNLWYDVEDGRYVNEEELLPSVGLGEQEGSTPLTPTQNHPLSPPVS